MGPNDQTLLRRTLLLMGLASCAGCSTRSRQPQTQWTEGDVVVDETVLALGIPNEDLLKEMANDKVVAFIVKNNTYLLVEGGRRLMEFPQKLDSKRLSLVANQKGAYIRDQTIWGSLEFLYAAPSSGGFSAAEREILAKLDFKPQRGTTYKSSVSIKGAVYPALPVTSRLTGLRQSRRVVFYAPPAQEQTPDLSVLAKLPDALKIGD